MKIGLKLTLLFFSIAFFSISIIGYLSYSRAKNSLEEESFNRLTAVREMKSAQIEDYFLEIQNQTITSSESYTFVNAMNQFKNGFNFGGFRIGGIFGRAAKTTALLHFNLCSKAQQAAGRSTLTR